MTTVDVDMKETEYETVTESADHSMCEAKITSLEEQHTQLQEETAQLRDQLTNQHVKEPSTVDDTVPTKTDQPPAPPPTATTDPVSHISTGMLKVVHG